jgi:HSP20 family protein
MTETRIARRRSGSNPMRFNSDLEKMRNSMQRMFDSPLLASSDFLDLPFSAPFAITSTPAVEITETKKELRVTAELPGMRLEDIQVEIDDDVLTIRGEKQEEKTSEEGEPVRYHIVERSYGAFERSFSLPRSIDSDNIKAEFGDGVLSIRLPKNGDAKVRGRRVSVTSK